MIAAPNAPLARRPKAKGQKGVGMEGLIASWYARQTAKDTDRFEQTAQRIAPHVGRKSCVLEIAPGPGYLAIELAKRIGCRVVGVDISRSFVRMAREHAAQAGVENVAFEEGDAADLPFPDDSFDFIVCTAAFKNFAAPLAALNEMHRVLKPGGIALIIDLRKDFSAQDVDEYVRDKGLINGAIIKWTFNTMLKSRAYTAGAITQLVAQSKFGPGDIRFDTIAFELWLRKPMPHERQKSVCVELADNAYPNLSSVSAAAAAPMHVVIIGGGIGGLTLAQGLKKAGVGVAVYERDRTRTDRVQGYRVHINPAGSRALHECLPPYLFDAFTRTCGRRSGGISFLTERMKVLTSLDFTEALELLQEDAIGQHRSVSRITLRQALLSGLDDVVHFGKTFTHYEETAAGRVIAHFEDGSNAEGDVLVAADGTGSRVRRQLLPEAEPIDTGAVGIAGKVFLDDEIRRNIAPRLLGGLSLVSAPGGFALFVALQELDGAVVAGIGGNDDSAAAGAHFDNTRSYLMWALGAQRAAFHLDGDAKSLSGAQLRALALRAMAGWDERLIALVRLSDESTINAIAIRTAPPIAPWRSGRVTLLGDAIHAMTPYRGIGANVALKDALHLARALIAAERGERPLFGAIGEYEAGMRDYGFRAVRTSLKAMQQAMPRNRLQLALSRAFFRTIDRVPPLKRAMFRGTGDE
jgi:salicylate hydroxylase